MTTKQFYSELWKPILATIVPTILIMGVTTLIMVRIGLARHEEKIEQNKKDIERSEFVDNIQTGRINKLQQDVSFLKGVQEITNSLNIKD
jgi:hypothetical protein